MRDSPRDMWEAITAGHVQRGPSLLVPLVNICSVMDQQLDALQVPRQHGLMDGSHTYIQAQKNVISPQRRLWFDERGSPAGDRFPHRRGRWCPG